MLPENKPVFGLQLANPTPEKIGYDKDERTTLITPANRWFTLNLCFRCPSFSILRLAQDLPIQATLH